MTLDRRRLLGGLAATCVTGVVGCSGESRSPDRSAGTPTWSSASPSGAPTTPLRTDKPRPRLGGAVAHGLNVPWGIAFLPSGEALVSERDAARVVRVSSDGGISTVRTVPGVDARVGGELGEGGLLGIALAPNERHLFAYMSTRSDNRIVRMRWSGGRLGDPEPILTGIPRNVHHNGGRLVFGPDEMLYASTGDALESGRAQDKDSLGGKILRITPRGEPAPGNPFGNEVYSYGHRNVEGLAFDDDGRLWASEFGDSTADELNLIEKGGNYGWPEVEGRSDETGYVNPKVTWPTEQCSPSGIAIAGSTAFLGALQGECVYAVPLHQRRTGRPERLISGEYGRIRTVAATPAGDLWVTTSNTDGRTEPASRDDRILRIALS